MESKTRVEICKKKTKITLIQGEMNLRLEFIRHKLPVELGSYLPGFTGKLCLWNQSYNLPVNVGKCPKWLVNYDCDFRVVIYQWNWANVDLVTLKVQSWLVNFVTEFNVIIYQLKSAKELSLKISWIFDCL